MANLEKAIGWLLEHGWRLSSVATTAVQTKFTHGRLSFGVPIPLLKACYLSSYDPGDLDEVPIQGVMRLSQIIYLLRFASSVQEAERLITAGVVWVDGQAISKDKDLPLNKELDITVTNGDVVTARIEIFS